MKKLITICLFMAITLASQAQVKKAAPTKTPVKKTSTIALTSQKGPTKEETISWLQEKFEKCGLNIAYWGDNLIDTKYDINECRVIVSAVRVRKGKQIGTITIEFPTTGAKIWKEYKWADNYFTGIITYESQVVKKTINNWDENSDVHFSNMTSTLHIDGGTSAYQDLFSISLKEDNIVDRIEKAMEHLSSFCPKKKETF